MLIYNTQKQFRVLLDAIANPGTRYQSEENGGDISSHMLLIGQTLLDKEVSVYIEEDEGFQRQIVELTHGSVASVYQADYIFIPTETGEDRIQEILKVAKKGTYDDPQDSATMIIACKSFEGDEKLTMKGPGIKGEKCLCVPIRIKKVICFTQQMRAEYPCGIDLFFVDADGDILGIPRLCLTI